MPPIDPHLPIMPTQPDPLATMSIASLVIDQVDEKMAPLANEIALLRSEMATLNQNFAQLHSSLGEGFININTGFNIIDSNFKALIQHLELESQSEKREENGTDKTMRQTREKKNEELELRMEDRECDCL